MEQLTKTTGGEQNRGGDSCPNMGNPFVECMYNEPPGMAKSDYCRNLFRQCSIYQDYREQP